MIVVVREGITKQEDLFIRFKDPTTVYGFKYLTFNTTNGGNYIFSFSPSRTAYYVS